MNSNNIFSFNMALSKGEMSPIIYEIQFSSNGYFDWLCSSSALVS